MAAGVDRWEYDVPYNSGQLTLIQVCISLCGRTTPSFSWGSSELIFLRLKLQQHWQFLAGMASRTCSLNV